VSADREAVLALVFQARNLAEGAIDDVATGLDRVGSRASELSGKVVGAFRSMGPALSDAAREGINAIASGGSAQGAALAAGGALAGGLVDTFGEKILAGIAGSGIIAAVGPALAGIGTAMGGLVAAAIPIGIAALPFILIGALVAAVAILIVNEDIRNRVISFATGLVGTIASTIGSAFGTVVDTIGRGFGLAWDFVTKAIPATIAEIVTFWLEIPAKIGGLGLAIVQTIVGGLVSLPGRVADIIGGAFRNLHLDIGPFHISGGGVTIDLPHIDLPHFASGVLNFGGGLAVVGEKGPEVVRLPGGSDVLPAGQRPDSAALGVRLVGVSASDLVDLVEREVYFRLQLASPIGANQ
jgi:MFS family permease